MNVIKASSWNQQGIHEFNPSVQLKEKWCYKDETPHSYSDFMEANLIKHLLLCKIELAPWVQILEQAVCISLHTNAFGKQAWIHIFCLLSTMGK